MISHFMFKSLTNLEFIQIYNVKYGPNTFSFQMATQLYQYQLSESILTPNCYDTAF